MLLRRNTDDALPGTGLVPARKQLTARGKMAAAAVLSQAVRAAMDRLPIVARLFQRRQKPLGRDLDYRA
jgi:hypothetical protein